MDSTLKNSKSSPGFPLYFLSSTLLAASLFFINIFSGLIFIASWGIQFYLWILLKAKLSTFPNLDKSQLGPIILKRYSLGNFALTLWAALFIVLSIFLPHLEWVLYLLSFFIFLPAFSAFSLTGKVHGILDKSGVGFRHLLALESLINLETIVIDEIITGEVVVDDVLLAEGIKSELFDKIIGTFLHGISSENHVTYGMKSHFKQVKTYPVKHIKDFSEAAPWSSMYLESIGTVFLGPAELLMKQLPEFVGKTFLEGRQVFAMAVSPEEYLGEDLPENLFTLAFLILSEPILPGMPQLLEAVQKSGKKVCVLTAQDPIRMANLCHYFDISISQDVILGNLDGWQKGEIAQQIAEQEFTAFISDRHANVHCCIGSDMNTQADITIPSQDFSSLAAVFTMFLQDIEQLL